MISKCLVRSRPMFDKVIDKGKKENKLQTNFTSPLTIYPNPATGKQITIQLPVNEEALQG